MPQLGAHERVWVPARTLWFLDDQRLIATLVLPGAGRPTLSARGRRDDSLPFVLRAAVIEASTGAILSKPEWPSDSRRAGIIAVNNSGIVTLVGTELTLFSRNLTARRRLNLPAPGGGPWWNVHTSWSGKRVLLEAGQPWVDRPWLWLDAENLEIVASWRESVTGAVAVSDESIVMAPGSQHFGDAESPLLVKRPGDTWRPIPFTVGASNPRFAGPDVLCFLRFVPGILPPRSQAFQMAVQGADAFGAPVRAATGGPCGAVASRGGNRLVALQQKLRGFHPALDIGGHSVLKALEHF